MKNLLIKLLVIVVITLSISVLTSCQKNTSADLKNTQDVNLKVLDSDCPESLPFMREEEKLAHDLYVNMYQLWPIPIFKNISKSENVHTEAIKGLLVYFEINDPVQPGIGEFTNPLIQQRYNEFLLAGSVSLIEGLIMGAIMEEIEIIDLRNEIKDCSEDTILTVYGRLLRASGFHLRAFYRNLAYRGYNYLPKYLSQEEFDEIVNTGTPPVGGGCDTTLVKTITPGEKEGLLYIMENEKLSYDLYFQLYEKWGLRIFNNISKSETIHMEKIFSLIEFFKLEDPRLPGYGSFEDEEIQNRYNNLITQGHLSILEGLIVGADVEEHDIYNLLLLLEETDNRRISRVYNNLKNASANHLRAYVKQLTRRGYTYVPQYINQDLFDEITGN